MVVQARKSRHFRSEFNQREFEKWQRSYWSLPATLGKVGEDGTSALAELRGEGGDGVAAILPLMGLIACSKSRDNFALSVQEIARLTNVDPATVDHAAGILAKRKLLGRTVRTRHGEWLTHWSVAVELCGRTSHVETAYFSFPMRLIYGGNWAMMPRVQRSIYLGAATAASIIRPGNVSDHWIVRELVDLRSNLAEIRAFMSNSQTPLRLALLTATDLSARTGVSKRSLTTHLRELRAPEGWLPLGEAVGDLGRLTFSPITVYPTLKRALLFFFRDNVPPLPWDFLNDAHRNDIWRAGGDTLLSRVGKPSPLALSESA